MGARTVIITPRSPREVIRRLQPDDQRENHRLDKWLWCCRFYKTRSLATAAINGGKVHLNAERVKPVAPGAHRRPDQRVLAGVVAEFEVLGMPARRGPAAEAQAHYRETPASALRRARLRDAAAPRAALPAASAKHGPTSATGAG